ncbi:MAG: hypothetical protein B6D35_14110 [Candidatus Brocadia sp. UTAMX2]|nr:MAG: hypothetical protein B6D35_14110 [Candidatus Brocadia sp. UTAMX2]
MRKYNLGFVLFSILLLAGCSANKMQTNNIYENSKIQTYLPYSDLARISHLSLKNDGYLIGIEKRERESLGGIPEKHYPDRFSPITKSDTDSENKQSQKTIKKKKKIFEKYTKSDTAMLITHVARYFGESDNSAFNEHRKPYFLYNAYDVYKDDNLNYEDGYEALECLEKRLVSDLKEKVHTWRREPEKQEKPYSHIIILSMGWNNNQQESIYRYNTILDNVKNVAHNEKGDYFKPLVIGFTWPSVWSGIENNWLKKNTVFLFSYFTKQGDADEIGCTIANWVIHKVVLSAKEEFQAYCKKEYKEDFSPRIVAIGHSMGARLLSQAIISKEYIKPELRKSFSTSHADLFIGLQGAFSAKRFVANEGGEGSPYAGFKDYETKFTLTSSQYDTANQTARFITGSRHVGGKYGLAYARKKKNKDVFRVIKWTNNYKADLDKLSPEEVKEDEKKVILIDAGVIVDGCNSNNGENKPNDAHNDILDEDMGQLIWLLIKRFAPFSVST